MVCDVCGWIRRHKISISFAAFMIFLLIGIALAGYVDCILKLEVPLPEDAKFLCPVLALPDLIIVLSATSLGALLAFKIHRDWSNQKHGEHDGQPGSLKMSGHGWRLEVSDSGWKFEASGPGVKCRDGASPEPELHTEDDGDKAQPTGKQGKGAQ